MLKCHPLRPPARTTIFIHQLLFPVRLPGSNIPDDQIVLPTLARLLGDPNADVRQAAGESLVGVASLMKPLDLGHHVLTIVLQLAHDDEQVGRVDAEMSLVLMLLLLYLGQCTEVLRLYPNRVLLLCPFRRSCA